MFLSLLFLTLPANTITNKTALTGNDEDFFVFTLSICTNTISVLRDQLTEAK